ncbi:MAG: hypothetical protein JNK58_07195 [Phycisphaerae bacterium]|nr:hypothetical protein [Phycisphaerae bacterium]
MTASRTHTVRTRTLAALVGTLTLAAAGMLSGCASYANYPAIGTAKDDAAVNDPNVAPVPTLMRTALLHVVNRFPVEGDYVVNLPEGMTARRAQEFMMKLGDPRARLPQAESESLPVYHITRVWLRPGGTSEVEILRPVYGVGAPGDQAEFQPVTVRLRRTPLEPYKVDSVRVWPIGIAVPPPLFGWDGSAR